MAKKIIEKGSVVYDILECLTYSTEISPKLFHLLDKHHYKVYMNEVKKMTTPNTYVNIYGEVIENIKALTILGSGRYKTIRLRQKAFDKHLISLLGPTEESRYMINAYNKYQDHYNVTSIERNHTLAEIHYLFQKYGVFDYWIDQDDTSFSKKGIFINKRLITSLYPSKAAIHSGRGYGLLLYPHACHHLYYYDNCASHWLGDAEKRSRIVNEKFVRDRFKTFKNVETEFFENAVIISHNDRLALDLLSHTRNQDIKQGLRIDDTYRNFRYIRKDHMQEMLFILKNDQQIFRILKRKTFGENPISSSKVTCDGITMDDNGYNKKYWLFTFDFNLTRIRKFKKAMDHYDDEQFIVYGFDWQNEFLMKYFKTDNKNVEIYTTDIKSLIKLLGIKM